MARPIAFRLPPARVLAALAFVLVSLASLGFAGCEDLTGPSGGGGKSSLTLSNLWPNEDGRYWRYDARTAMLEQDAFAPLPPGSNVPPITLAAVREMLKEPVTEQPGFADEYEFLLQFDGQITTGSGVTAQWLREIYPWTSPGLRALPAAGPGERFLQRLAAARPDLRARLAAIAPAGPEADIRRFGPYFIHGYAWRKTPAWIGTYGDVDTLLAWKFLEAMVRPGHTFSHRLVPSLATDIWLHASVERRVAVQTPDGETVSNAIEVLYLIDFGVSSETDAMGNVLGRYRMFDYGTVTYAPGVGPVRDYERRFAYIGQGSTLGAVLLEMDLTDTGLAPVTIASR